MDSKKYELAVQEYIDNDKTVAETAKDLGITKRTLQNYFEKVRKTNPVLYGLIRKKQESQIQKGRKKGGTIGKRKPSLTPEEIREIAETMIKEDMSYAEAEMRFQIPKSTIYDLINKSQLSDEIKAGLKALSEAHNRNMSVIEFTENTRNKK